MQQYVNANENPSGIVQYMRRHNGIKMKFSKTESIRIADLGDSKLEYKACLLVEW